MKNRIVVEIEPETMALLMKLAAEHNSTTASVAGRILDKSLTYQVEVERMCPPTIRSAERIAMTLIPDEMEKIKISKARWLAYHQLNHEIIDIWPDEDVVEYLEANGYLWINGEWRATEDINLVPPL